MMTVDTIYKLTTFDLSNVDADFESKLAQTLERAVWMTHTITNCIFDYNFIKPEHKANYFGNGFYIETKAWQDDIVVFRDTLEHVQDSNLPHQLHDREDYTVHYSTGTKQVGTSPIIGVRLNKKLEPNEFIRIAGTYGWSDEFPHDIQKALAEICITAIQTSSPASYLRQELYGYNFVHVVEPYLSKEKRNKLKKHVI